jgi:ketosteroid isomerase-like protein
MTSDVSAPPVPPIEDDPSWPTSGRFVQALSERDFAALRNCLHPDVRFRAVVPPGPFELNGSAAVTAKFETWFSDHEIFEVLDAAIGQVGTRMYLRWRLRVAAAATPHDGRIVEQHVFATGTAGIETFDLLCSGFQPEHPASRHHPRSTS